MAILQQNELTPWNWPQADASVDLGPYVLREWREHHGDSRITLARPRKPRGATSTPPPAYLLKKGTDAVGERIYSLLARFLDLPSAVVAWADYSAFPVAAIRFEPAAWRPNRLDIEVGIAQSGDRQELLRNPQDYYRHLALAQLLEDWDGTECMVRDQVLFRVDAAAAGDRVWSTAVRMLFKTGTDDVSATIQRRFENIGWLAERLRTTTSQGYVVYLDMLKRLAHHPELDEMIAHDLRTCPAAHEFCLDPHRLPPLDDLSATAMLQVQAWVEVPLMQHMASAFSQIMAQQRVAIQQYLVEASK